MSAFQEYLQSRGLNGDNYDDLEAANVWNAAVGKALTTIMDTLESRVGKAHATQFLSMFVLEVVGLVEE